MKTKTLNKLIKNYKLVCTNLGFKINPNFDKEFLHIKRMKGNSTKISFIKKDKIEGLEKNVKGFVLKPNCKEQREKYFTAVKPSKFLSSMILQDDNRADLFSKLSEQFNKDFITNVKSKLVLYSGNDIGEQYNNNNSVVGCMSGQDSEWFKVYAKTEGLQLATLKDDNDTLLIRALLWYDKENNNYWLDNSYEQSAINGDNEIRKEYQKKLIIQVVDYLYQNFGMTEEKENFRFGCNFAKSLNNSVVEEVERDFKIKLYKYVKRKIATETINTGKEDKNGETIYTEEETERSKDKILVRCLIPDFDYSDFDYYPYCDTFQSIGKNSGKWFLNSNNGDYDYVCCQSQHGEDENDSGIQCECCDSRFNEDDVSFSDYDDCYYCYDCASYSDYENDTILRDNLVEHHRTGDLINRDCI